MPHAIGAAVSPAQNVPTAQAVHCTSEVLVAGAVCWVPAGQVPVALQVAAFTEVLNSPLPHAVHMRSLVDVPCVLT